MVTRARDEPHHLLSQLDADRVPDTAALPRECARRRHPLRHRPSWAAALRAGQNFAERSGEILRSELGGLA